ncbi:MAG: lipid-binding SYLF domain-containing protein [Verrucomicrobia bacterium]|nr:lipid-binding SYLF domain-containing protein [Verrucomicrobiota bacterium]
MKKLLLLSLFALSGLVIARAAPSAASRPEYVSRVETCEAILREFMANPATAIPASVLQGARAIVIVNQFKAGFLLGVKDGYGVIMVKKADGHWSLPVLISAGELSFGLQVGANSLETVMVITDDQTPRLLFNQRFNVGVDAKAVAGPKAAEAEKNNREMITAPVLVYSKTKGLYAGATVKAGWLERNDQVNYILYNTQYTMPELLYSNWVTAPTEVVPLMQYVQSIAP